MGDAAWWVWEEDFTGALAEVRKGFDEVLGGGEMGAKAVPVAGAVGLTGRDDSTGDRGIPRLDSAYQLLKRAVQGMTETMGDELSRKETSIAGTILEAVTTLVTHHTHGVQLDHSEVMYELSMFFAVWTTHPHMEVKIDADAQFMPPKRRGSRWAQVRMSVPVLRRMSEVHHGIQPCKLDSDEEVKVMSVFGSTVLDSTKVINNALRAVGIGTCPGSDASLEADLLRLGWDRVKGPLTFDNFLVLVQIRKARFKHFQENFAEDADNEEVFESLGGMPRGGGTISATNLQACANVFGLEIPFAIGKADLTYTDFKDILSSAGTEPKTPVIEPILPTPTPAPRGIKNTARGITAFAAFLNSSVNTDSLVVFREPSGLSLSAQLELSDSAMVHPKRSSKQDSLEYSRASLLLDGAPPRVNRKSRQYLQNGAGLLNVFCEEKEVEPSDSVMQNKLTAVFADHRQRLLDVAVERGSRLYDYLALLISNERNQREGDTRYLYQRKMIRRKDEKVLNKPQVGYVVMKSGNELSFKDRCGRTTMFEPTSTRSHPPRCFRKWQESNKLGSHVANDQIQSMLNSIKLCGELRE